jgi:integrase
MPPIGQIVPANPASAVRGPKHVVKTGSTPVLEGDEWHKLLDAIPPTTLRDLRDRALIATLTYNFARINAALKMKVEDCAIAAPVEPSAFMRKAASIT